MAGDGGAVSECRAAGRFRKAGLRPLVGDYVAFDPPTATAAGSIREIQERRNTLLRPAAANIDTQLIVASPHQPAADLLLVDRLILQARANNIEPIVCVNKADLFADEAKSLAASYNGVCKALPISAEEGQGIDELSALLKNRTVCLAGQSAVGKSTLINRLCSVSQETGGLSAKTERGKHTTRSTELFYSPDLSAYILDTPGFSVFEGVRMEPRMISRYYADFAPFADKCRFASCLHRDEPECAVKQAVEEGAIDRGRYDRYLELLSEEEQKAWSK